MCLFTIFYESSALVDCWSSFSIRRIIYKCKNVCPFYYTVYVVNGKVTSWKAVVTRTDRHKSVRNRCIIEIVF